MLRNHRHWDLADLEGGTIRKEAGCGPEWPVEGREDI